MFLCNGELPLFFVIGVICALTYCRALDSMSAGKRLPESRFSALNLYAHNQKPLIAMFSRASGEGNDASS